MRLAGVRPNPVTFVGVLWACANAGMLNEARGYFDMMQKEYRISPVTDHLACLVDMYVRLGQLEEAFEVAKKMKFKPSEQIWIMLIAGCVIHGNFELASFAADRLLQLKPKDTDSYVMALKAYQSAGRWEDVSRVQELMQIGMSHDWSWISIRDKVHFFKSDDPLHLCEADADTDKLLEDLRVKAKSHGYEPVQQGVKSELLAVAFGMLNTREGMPVRVLKSRGICRDSHDLLNHVSLLTNRKIVVRDSKGLHIFVYGSCPCRGFGALL